MNFQRTLASLIVLVSLFSCNQASDSKDSDQAGFHIDYEKFTLDNGLNVIFHIDRSDPVVAVALTTHVGSAREKEGRTGFAHLFEHLLFLESENLGKGGLDQMSARIGGSGANGSTSRDRTNYFQTVPKDALEKMIWAEADKLGFFINTVTDPVLAKEKQVVKNEKRQAVDNRPYGHVNYVIGKNLYPQGHPYNWQVIGSLEDLQNATLDDVKEFYRRWYTPNNTTLTISGDFNTEQAKEWVHKYFDEIKRGEEVPPLEKQPANLSETKKLYYEDNFARTPQLTMTWPSVPQYHPDSYPLEVLATYLSDGKDAPFNKLLIDEKQLTDNVTMFNFGSELAGEFRLIVNAFDGKNLNDVATEIESAFSTFETTGIPEEDLERIKAGQETDFYSGLSSVLGKGFQLAQYEIFAGDPGFINEDVQNILAVTPQDVKRVYETYIKDKNYVATSFVPLGATEVILEGSQLAEVVEEQIIEGAEEAFDASIAATYERTPSSFDRSVEPPYGNAPELAIPNVWESSLSSGMTMYGITNNEVPLVQFRIEVRGGQLLEEQPNGVGVSNLLAQLLERGTANKTTAELEKAIDQLGASINISAGSQSITVSGAMLSKNYAKTLALVEEMLLQPRWDTTEFDLIKQSTLSQLQRQLASPNSIASNEYAKLIYGEGHVFANNILGTPETVNAISMEDLKAYYESNFSPSVTRVFLVGAIDKVDAISGFDGLNENWTSKEVAIPEITIPAAPEKSTVYFYDVPDAKQSVLRFGYPALAITDPEYNKANLMNYRFGGGGFASQLTQELRESKGYTYGIRSRFSGSTYAGPFTISSGVRSNVTLESALLVKELMENYGSGFNEEDLKVTKSFYMKSGARSFETGNAKLNMLYNIGAYNMPYDYAKQREKTVQEITVDDIKSLSEKYLNANKMIYLVVGDARTQMSKLEQLGFGIPVLLNPKDEIKK